MKISSILLQITTKVVKIDPWHELNNSVFPVTSFMHIDVSFFV